MSHLGQSLLFSRAAKPGGVHHVPEVKERCGRLQVPIFEGKDLCRDEREIFKAHPARVVEGMQVSA